MKYCKYPGCSQLVKTGYCEKHSKRERYCAHPRCPNLATIGSWCDEHQPRRKADTRRGTAKDRGYDYQWTLVRDAYLAAHPLCELCEAKGLITPAEMVHHIVRIKDGGARFDFNNLQSVCYRCHESIHSNEGHYKRKP